MWLLDFKRMGVYRVRGPSAPAWPSKAVISGGVIAIQPPAVAPMASRKVYGTLARMSSTGSPRHTTRVVEAVSVACTIA